MAAAAAKRKHRKSAVGKLVIRHKNIEAEGDGMALLGGGVGVYWKRKCGPYVVAVHQNNGEAV